jgi:ABC-type glycerol-3-phosphate transport system permease component
VFNDGSVVFEGSSADAHETTLQVTNPTADRTITFKDASGTVAFTSDIPSTTDGLSEGTSNLYFTDERAQDAVAAAIAAGTHSNITITYDDSTNKLSFAAENGVADSTTDNLTEGSTNQYFTAERAQDAIADAIAAGTHSNITITYDDNLNKFTFAAENGVADSDTDDLTEGTTNLYFTNTRAVDALEAVVPNFTEIDINSVATQVAATTAVATASTVTAYQFAKADYRSGKFLVKAETSSHTEISEILVTLDGSDNVAITEYAIVGTNGNLVDVTADVSGANVRIRVTTINNSTDVTVVGTLIA